MLVTEAGVVALWWALAGWLLARQVAVALRYRSGCLAPARRRRPDRRARTSVSRAVAASTAVAQIPSASSTCSSVTTSGGIIRTTLPNGPQVSSSRPSSAAFCWAR